MIGCSGAASGSTTQAITVGTTSQNTSAFNVWPALPGDLCLVVGGGGTHTPTGFADSQSNTYTSVGGTATSPASWAFAATLGTHGLRTDTPDTITGTWSGTSDGKNIMAMGFTSPAGTPIDATSIATASGTSTTPSVTSGTLAGVGNGGNGELVVAVLTTAAGAGAPTWGAPFAQLGRVQAGGTAAAQVAVANVTGTSAVTASATIGVSSSWTMTIFAVKAATITQKDLVGSSVFGGTYAGGGTRLQNSALFDGYANAGSTKARTWAQNCQKMYFSEDQWPSDVNTPQEFGHLSDAAVYQMVTFRGRRAVGGGTTSSLNSMIAAIKLYKNYICSTGATTRFMISPWNEAGGYGKSGDFGDGTNPSKGATGTNPYTSGPGSVTEAQAAANYIAFHQYYIGGLGGKRGLGGCGVPVFYCTQLFSPNSALDFFPGRDYCNVYGVDYYAGAWTGPKASTLANSIEQAGGTYPGTTFTPPLALSVPEMGVSSGGAVPITGPNSFDVWLRQQLVAPLLSYVNAGNFLGPTIWYSANPTGANAVNGSTPTAEIGDLQYWWDSLNPQGGSVLAVTTTSLPSGTQSTAYAGATLAASGGTSPYTWACTGLPTGITCSTGGVLSGTPTQSGSFSVAVTVTDSASAQAFTSLSLTVAAAAGPSVLTLGLPAATQSDAYGPVSLAATGGTVPYTWAVAAGALPPGISMTTGGVISGTSAVPGTYAFTAQVTDAASLSAVAALSLTVNSTLAVTTAALPGGQVGTAYATMIMASGGVAPYSWGLPPVIAGVANTAPPGLDLDPFGNLTGIPTSAGTYSFTVAVTDAQGTTIAAAFSVPVTAAPAPPFDSLIIADQIELLGGSVPSTNPACAGAIFRLQPGYDLGEPQPTSDFVASLVLDGERPFGYRSSNRTITLPLMIEAPDFSTLAGALEVLMDAIDAQAWTLTWTRKTAALPLVLDCFRAQPSQVQWGGADQWNINPVAQLQLTFQALPYGRSDQRVQIAVASPLPGLPGQAAPVVIDNFATVSGSNWVQSTRHVYGPDSAKWDPCVAPLNDCTGGGSYPGAAYSATLATPVNILGLSALTVQAGFGSDYYSTWHSGPVLFVFTLTDDDGNSVAFSRSITVHASSDSTQPKWTQVTAGIPQGAEGFDYTTVSSYSVTVTNRGYHTLRYTKLYLDALTANPPSLQAGVPIRGAMYSILGVTGTARTPCSLQFQQAPSTGTPVTVALPGPTGVPLTWTCPEGVTTLTSVQCFGATGAGGSEPKSSSNDCGGGGGGAEFAQETSVTVVPLAKYTYELGAAGAPSTGTGAGGAGGASIFTAGALTVTANGGGGGHGGSNGAGGLGGSGSTNTTHYSGGNGGNGSNNSHTGGGGGSAGTTGAGGSASGSTGGTGGSGGGSPGATGRTSGGAGAAAPGGGGAGSWAKSTGYEPGGAGSPGIVQLSYTQMVTPFSTLIAHIPGPQAPQDLAPLITFGDTDVPNGSTEYPVQSLIPGTYADFSGTYTVAVVANAWNSSSSSRTLTLAVKQYEYAGGPSYTTSVSRTFTPSTDIINGIVVLGELTLPLKDVAPDNLAGLYTVTLTDTNTSDTFLDCLFLDTLGQTAVINIAASGAYVSYFLDEPDPTTDIGRVMGSVFDRDAAISVMDNTLVSGGPLFLQPGDNLMLVYAVEGAPALSVSYSPRWWLDRLS
jgi:hypothetical protein